MGYGGNFAAPEIEPSVGVLMDTYQGGNHADPNYDHLAIFRDGVADHNDPEALAGPVPALTSFGNIENGQEYQLRVTHNAITHLMTVYWDCVERLSETVDIEDILGSNTAKWGFTAATGGLSNAPRVQCQLDRRRRCRCSRSLHLQWGIHRVNAFGLRIESHLVTGHRIVEYQW